MSQREAPLCLADLLRSSSFDATMHVTQLLEDIGVVGKRVSLVGCVVWVAG